MEQGGEGKRESGEGMESEQRGENMGGLVGTRSLWVTRNWNIRCSRYLTIGASFNIALVRQ